MLARHPARTPIAPSAIGLLSLTLAMPGCGSSPAPVAPPVEPTVASAAPVVLPEPEPEIARELPTACAEGPVCTLPPDFAQRLCAADNPETALHLFAPKTPWQRVYLKRSFQAWHVGGHGELRELHRGEEVIVVGLGKTSQGGMQIGGRAFEVLRWDGKCVSLMEDEIDFHRPPTAAPANIALQKLAPAYQAAFAEDARVRLLRGNQERLCQPKVAENEPGKSKCEIARRQLSLAIAQAVGRGAPLPPLAYVP